MLQRLHQLRAAVLRAQTLYVRTQRTLARLQHHTQNESNFGSDSIGEGVRLTLRGGLSAEGLSHSQSVAQSATDQLFSGRSRVTIEGVNTAC